jgi:hypothetical protein
VTRVWPLALALVFLPGPALSAQDDGTCARSGRADPVARADSLFEAGDAEASLVLLRETLVACDSTGYPMLWRAARAAVAFGVTLPVPYPQNHLFEEGMRWGALAEAEAVTDRLGVSGERLDAGRPPDVSGGFWQYVATGRRAKNAAPRYGARLANEIWDGSLGLLARAPGDPRVHWLLGRLHFEIMSLSAVERVLGRVIVGGDVFGRATWDEAEAHLTRAVAGAPGDPVYLVDLALLHAARGRPGAARVLAERVLGLSVDTAEARETKAAARRLLDRLGSGWEPR